ncbi:MAG TPA: proline--tRNA ligase [Chitinophagales bacterium]|nr:proline--tRNA ligase [Chitinophagales bacterium]HMZ88802.1 proline--tRNA ligase [Chitinophagales bacterium]HNE45237.1 proline--tRNA ligase [Chitinophagales bacterium]HNF68356.1 proline--tRNA ligase [Chitinophagales bacterium]HNI54322.1 proline--tRNA ligase [Chitinophagales bacterium]
MAEKITKRGVNYSEWYNDLVIQSGLAEYAAVRGCMVIKPYGWAIWENMKTVLDTKFKETGHVNASFPLLIPKGFLEQEEGHAEGFAKECAVVTHYRLKTNPDKKGKLMVDPESRLEEELIIRPTSETIIWNCYKGWIQSYRDLPILINQWANVMRWEMRTRLFLRTAEFHWQEGHTAHATSEEAVEETVKMLNVYADFMENYMAVPVIKGVKTANERFAGAVDTYCVEGLMQDGKALQCGTSHFLGQNFAKAFDVKFLTREGKQEYAWATSWGVSTRMMGALIMAHSDDEGLVIPPRLAPLHVVIVPIYKTEEQLAAITAIAEGIMKELKDLKITVKYDDNDQAKPGWKFAEYELKGVPVRIAMGGRDVENGTVEIARRDTKEKVTVKNENLGLYIQQLLEDIQQNLYNRALQFRTASTHEVDSWDDFKKQIEIGGFVSAHWDGTSETEEKIKEETKATIRCIPLDAVQETGNCVYSGKPSTQRVLFARAY